MPVNFSDGVKMLENGQLDLMNNVSKNAKREQTLSFSTYSSGANYGCLIVNSDNDSIASDDYAAFNKIRVGIMEGSIFQPPFEEYCKEHNITPEIKIYKHDVDLKQAMQDGSIDGRIVSSSYQQEGSRVVAKFAPVD